MILIFGSMYSEAVPLIKTGGLADVVALPVALNARQSCEARVCVPGYRQALAAAEEYGIHWWGAALTIEAGGTDHLLALPKSLVRLPTTCWHAMSYLAAMGAMA